METQCRLVKLNPNLPAGFIMEYEYSERIFILSILNIMNNRNYFKLFLIGFIPLWGIITLFVFTTPCFIGDLTRIGGYSEQAFAPKQPQIRFQKPAFTKIFNLREYKAYHDVLVVGDSFSQNKAYGWQNYIAEKSGWSILTFHKSDVNIPDLLNSEAFQKHPPKIFIYEIAEHGLHDFRFKGAEHGGKSGSKRPDGAIQLNPVPKEKVVKKEALSFDMDISHGIHRLQKSIKKATGSRQKVFRLPLSNGRFFSNESSDEILIYYGDFSKNDINPDQWISVNSDLHKLQNRVQANGQTLFLLMIAADKSSIYKPYIQNSPKPILSALKLLGDVNSLNVLPIHEFLSQKIRTAGEMDIFLPNDTHWSNIGHSTAANAVIEYLRRTKNIVF
ncbi:MAG: hypothetical protein JEZ12_04915 [Desulfobacterium sp.]|nr:hypothetical protein [Desulfobacterium sp.]